MQFDACIHQGTMLDISLKGGVFVPDANPEFSVGQECRLKVFHGGTARFVELDGRVVYFHDHLIGIAFKPVSEETFRGFQKIIELNLAMPVLLERDLPVLLR